jgi:gliding motility-associated-like protein
VRRKKSPQTISFDWIVKEEFQMNQVLTILPHMQGDYLYQLDYGVPQTSPIFENISDGFHTVTVYDAYGCSNPVSRNDILVINYPRFFTPNDDSINDFWSISGLYSYPNSKVQIFDRYGKLIKVLNVNKYESWDGKYDGKLMPSSDYWFVVNYQINNSNKTFKANFSLIR